MPSSMSVMSVARSALLPGALVLSCPLSLAAQCELDWQPGLAPPGPDGRVDALAHLATGELVAGGLFEFAGDALVRGVACHDGTAWRALGGGVDGAVRAAVTLPNGDLVVGGWLAGAGGTPVSNVARWDGSVWSPLGSELDAVVERLVVSPSGELFASGMFSAGVAQWDGVSWQPLAGGPPMLRVEALATLPNGNLLAGGLAGVSTPDIAVFDGTSWAAVPGMATNTQTAIRDFAVLPNGDFYALGTFYGQSDVALWSGGNWSFLPDLPFNGTARQLALSPTAELHVRVVGFPSTTTVLRFDGVGWQSVGGSVVGARTLGFDDGGELYLGGEPRRSGALHLGAVARLVGTDWEPLDQQPFQAFAATLALPTGDVIVAGDFTAVGGVAAANIARWDGANYAPLGAGVDGPVTALALAPDGALVVSGDFANAGGAPAQRIARFDGVSWSTLGGGIEGPATELAAADGFRVGAIYRVLQGSVESAYVTEFDGQGWSPAVQVSGNPNGIDVAADGRFLIVGALLTPPPFELVGAAVVEAGVPAYLGATAGVVGLALRRKHDGTLWSVFRNAGPASFGPPGLYQITDDNFQLVTPFAFNGVLQDFAFLPDGDLVLVGPSVVEQVDVAGIARLTSGGWMEIDGGFDTRDATAIAVSPRGEVFVAGEFVAAGGVASVGLARAITGCAGAVASVGAGCSGSAGPVTLSANELPWVGGTFTAEAAGMAPLSLALHALGLQSNIVPLPLGAPGCSLIVEPIFLELLFPENGELTVPLAVPDATVLVGQSLLSQVIGIELSSSLALQQTTGSNALELTIGAL